jgi:hemerythrin-like domain-containing protein
MTDEPPTEPLRRRHAHLAATLDRVLTLVEELEPGAADTGPELVRAVAVLERNLLPHAEAEDCFLYPEVARLMGSHRATASMNVDHAFTRRYLRELRTELNAAADAGDGGLGRQQIHRLLAAANRLAGLLAAHFRAEEEVYFPLIEAEMGPDLVRRRVVDPIIALIESGVNGEEKRVKAR